MGFLTKEKRQQVLGSYDNKTYADGQASAVYRQYPPLVNTARPPGQWQTYDIVFHGPRFDGAGKVTGPARMTVFDNGVLVQDNVELTGPTAHGERPPYKATPGEVAASATGSRKPGAIPEYVDTGVEDRRVIGSENYSPFADHPEDGQTSQYKRVLSVLIRWSNR